jgi:hypothetical protein
MKTHVEFRSDKFPPYDSEETEINPGRFGKRLAEFLSAGLRSQGFEPEPLIAEDWGWVVPIKNDDFKLWIGCGNYDEYPDGFLCFIEPHKPIIRNFLKRVNTQPQVDAIQHAVDSILENAGVRERKWSTHEEFNHPTA